MSKRPFQENNSISRANSKKSKQDFDHFRAPIAVTSVSKNQQQPSNSDQKKLPLPPKATIGDEFDDDVDDEVLCLLSQQAEDEERVRKQQMSYTGFALNAQHVAGTSTQHGNLKSVFTEKISTELLVDNAAALQSKRISNSSQESSQKENLTAAAQMALTRQQNQINALEIQIKKQNSITTELQEQLIAKDGEVTNLRLSKRQLEEKVNALRLQKMNESVIKVDPEKEKLRKEIETLRAKLSLQKISEFPRGGNRTFNETMREEQLLDVPYFTNASMMSSQVTNIDHRTFDTEDIDGEPDKVTESDVMKIQLKLAAIHARIITGGLIDDAAVDFFFNDVVFMIRRIADYIDYLEADSDSFAMKCDTEPAYTACTFISIPVLRGKLTSHNQFRDSSDGTLRILQPENLFPEELCAKPRRIIALISTLARHSKKFSEKLLLENITSNSENPKTVASILLDSILFKISESDDIFDYQGLVMAVSSLLTSISSHIDKLSSEAFSDNLLRLFRAVLECQCDNPIAMFFLSEFLVNFSKSPKVRNLCVNYPKRQIDNSTPFRCCEYPRQACTLQLFAMFLLTAFDFDRDLNRFEINLTLRTTLNFNKMVLNMQTLEEGTLRFLKPDTNEGCSCFATLLNAALKLNNLSIAHRNEDLNQFVEGVSRQTQLPNTHLLVKELIKSSAMMFADLFRRIDPYKEFPIENLFFANHLENFCESILSGSCWDKNKTKTKQCLKAFELNEATAQTLRFINVSPNVLGQEEENVDEPMDDDDGNDDEHFVIRCREKINAGMKNCFM